MVAIDSIETGVMGVDEADADGEVPAPLEDVAEPAAAGLPCPFWVLQPAVAAKATAASHIADLFTHTTILWKEGRSSA